MKGFWALPAVLRVALASHATFTVLDDILSYPQFEVTVSDTVLDEADAELKVAALSQPSPFASSPDPEASSDLSAFDPDTNAHPHSTRDTKLKERVRDYERIRLGAQEYLCAIPEVVTINETVITPSPEELQQELVRATNHGWDLLKGMEGSCIFFNTGWWTYSFCFNQSVKQFHSLPPGRQVPLWPPVEDKSVQSFYLGKFGDADQGPKDIKARTTELKGKGKAGVTDAADVRDNRPAKAARPNTTETGLARLEQKGELKYMVQELSGGTTCDLTGKPRKVEIQFHCDPSVPGDRIAAIKEFATCTYLMIIQTSRLCSDVAFQPPRKDKPNPIRCSPIIADGKELADYPLLQQALQARAEAQHMLDEDTVLIDSDLPIYIGDIEFGGSRLLASPPFMDPDAPEPDPELLDISSTGWLKDRESLAKSLILGGHRETLIAVVASSDKEPMSSEKLQELGFKERELGQIDKFRKEMEKLSKGKAWKLEIVETVHGKEFRGIIETDEVPMVHSKEQLKDATGADGAADVPGEPTQQGGTEQGETAQEEERPEEGSEEVYKDEL